MYSPPADGHILPSCAYDIAPARARHPPAIQRASIAPGAGTSLAMMAGVVKMPTPITFDTISATPSLTRNERRNWLRVIGTATPEILPPAGGSAVLKEVGKQIPRFSAPMNR